MRNINIETNNCIITEDYIPLKILSDKAYSSLGYVKYVKGDSSLLEISYDEETHKLYRILLIICKDFSFNERYFAIPDSVQKSSIKIDNSDKIECEIFKCEIYKNAVRIIVSENSVYYTVISGKVLWELDKDCKLISLTVVGLSELEINHTITELEYTQNNL